MQKSHIFHCASVNIVHGANERFNQKTTIEIHLIGIFVYKNILRKPPNYSNLIFDKCSVVIITKEMFRKLNSPNEATKVELLKIVHKPVKA